MKQKLAMLLCAATMLTAVPTTVGAQEVMTETGTEASDVAVQEQSVNEAASTYKGTSENLNWKIDANGKLTITGSGDYASQSDIKAGNVNPGWLAYSDNIKTAEVKVSGITCTKNMFKGCQKLTSVDLSNLDTSKVTDMSSMFLNCYELTSVNVGNLDTSKVTNMRDMFRDCYKVLSLDVSKFDTSRVKDMGGMFAYCKKIKNVDVSHFDTAKVKDLSEMFAGCKSLTSLNVSGFKTSSVNDMELMFSSCSGLTSLDVSNFDTGALWSMRGMFIGCSGLTSLDISNFSTSYIVTDFLLGQCTNLTSVKMPANVQRTIEFPANDNFVWKDKNGTICTTATMSLSAPMLYTRYAKNATPETPTPTPETPTPAPETPTPTPETPTPAPETPTPTPDTPASNQPSSASITSAGIYVASQDNNGVLAGMVAESTDASDKEYRWLYYDIEADKWSVYSDWTLNNEWIQFNPGKAGDYLLQGEVRIANQQDTVKTDCIGVNHHPHIKGKCQMPYEGGGYLIGVESYDNTDYQYEMLILDCTLLAEGKDAWTYTTGRCGVDGNGFWTVWQPQYGYYWTLFRIYDKDGNLIDEDCYGFQNI